MELLDYAPDTLRAFPDANQERFWLLVAAEAAARIGKAIVDDGPLNSAMTEEQAVAFEREIIRFGMHQGKTVGEVSPDYWLGITETPFNKRLTKYLRSPYFNRNR